MKRFGIFVCIVFIGLSVRVFLACMLPLWTDERDSIHYLQQPLETILSGTINTSHPPGYSLFIKTWSYIISSTSPIGLRLSTLFVFLVNCYVIYFLANRYISDRFAFWALFSYSFSGYGLIFDWQIRPYTGLITLILFSLYILTTRNHFWKYVFMYIVNVCGLLYDYGFVWYLVPLLFILIGTNILKKYKNLVCSNYGSAVSIFLSIGSFLVVWIPHAHILEGYVGIAWIRTFTSPQFFIPYFLGAAHQNTLLIILMAFVCLAGCIVIRPLNTYAPKLLPLYLAGISLFGSMLITAFVPVLHVRTLQIVGLGILFIYAYFLYWLEEHKLYGSLAGITGIFFVNFFLMTYTHFSDPGKLLINFVR